MKLRFVRIAAGLLLTLGCTDSSGPRAPAEVGNYILAAVNGAMLPAVVIDNPGFRGEIVSGVILVLRDGAYRELRTSRITTPSGISSIESESIGTYSTLGTQLSFTIPATQSKPVVTYSGLLNGTTLIVTSEGSAYRYEKILPD